MKKILMIIFMYIIASNSYYGLVNEKGEKITDFQNTENIITTEQTQEQKDETVVNTEEIQQEQIEQKEKTKNEIEKNTIDEKNTKQESEQNKDKETIEENEVIIQTDNKSNNIKNQTDEKNNTSTNINTNTNTNNNNKCEHGDEGWYNTKAEAKAVYDNKVSSLDEQWESGKISTEEYRAKKPNGCEVWDCAECHKWTVSMY